MSEDGPFIAEGGPSAVGSYPHLRRVGDLIFVSGMGPRRPEWASRENMGPRKATMALEG
mgnify:CR=1 FL=1